MEGPENGCSLFAPPGGQVQGGMHGACAGAAPGAPVTLPVFLQEIDALLPTLDAAQQALLQSWRAYGVQQAQLLGIQQTAG